MICFGLVEVDAWKARVCREHGVEMFFEDDAEMLAHVDEATECIKPFSAERDVPTPGVTRPR
jgi:hypothetical protein